MHDATCSYADSDGDCPEPYYSRGYCLKHYTRWRKHGDPGIVKKTGVKAKPRPICTVIEDGVPCPNPVNSHGLCGKHTQRQRRNGDALVVKRPIIEDIEERFFSHVSKQADGCWMWTASLFPDGYGQFGAGGSGNIVGAHRWAYEHFVEEVPDDLTVEHLCHTRKRLICQGGPTCPHRRCVNPEHMEVLPRGINGQRGVQTKYVEETARALYARWKSGEGQVALAAETGLGQSTLSRWFQRIAAS